MSSATPAKPADEPRWAFLAWAGFAVLLLYAIVIGGGWLGMYVGAVRILDLVIAGVALAAWLIVAIRRPEWRPTTVIWPAFVVAIAAFALSVAASSYQRVGLEFLALAFIITALYLLLVRILALPYARTRIGGLMAIIAFVMGGAYVLWSVALWIEWWGLIGELRLPPFRPTHLGMTWGSPSVVLTVQVLMTAAAIGGIGFATRAARITVVGLVVLLAVVAIISGSRSGWLSLAGATVIIGALVLLDSRGREVIARVASDKRARYVAVPVVIVIGLVAIVVGPAMIDRFGSYGTGGRPTYWATALRMFEDAPLLGQGPGTWMIKRTAYTNPGELDLYQPHAHNQYLQTSAELGIIGLLAGLVAFGVVAWLLARAIRSGDTVRRTWAWASAFGLAYLALNVVVDVHTILTVAILVAIPIAALDATSDRGIGLPTAMAGLARPLRSITVGVLIVAVAASYLYLWRSEVVALDLGRAVVTAREDGWAAAREAADSAVAADPDIGVYQMTAALAAAGAGDWEAAEAGFRRVTETDDLPTAWLGLAEAQAVLGRSDTEVAASLGEAIRLGDQQAAITLRAARAFDRTGQMDAADDLYVQTLRLAPSLAGDDAWRASLEDARLAAIVDDAIATTPWLAWEIALMAGDSGRAQALAAERADVELVSRFIEAWDGDEAAIRDIHAWADAEPMDATRLAYAARVSDHAGDTDAATRYRRLLRLGPHFGPDSVDAGLGLRDPDVDAAMGTSTHFYGTYTYRRPMPLDLLVTGEPGLVIVSQLLEDDT